MAEFQIKKNDLTKTRIVETGNNSSEFTLNDGEILVKVDLFAFTANNITYGAMGDQIGYWQFFPPTYDPKGEWGILPVWGFADVITSNTDDIQVGDRFYGYFPPANFLKMTPTSIAPTRFIDGSAHRASLPPGYNMYRRVLAETGYDRSADKERALLYPLHLTSFCLWDALQDKNWYGAEQILILSASSKTSIGLAYAVAADENAPHCVAVTSARNKNLVEGLDLYGSCVTYDALDQIDARKATVIVDMSGNRPLLAKLHGRLADNMKHCINVGLTHWEEFNNDEGSETLIMERSEFFFAPGHIQKRISDWGPTDFANRSGGFLQETAAKSRTWLNCVSHNGLNGLSDKFADICEGRIQANEGVIIKL
jgi:hypothetical protein